MKGPYYENWEAQRGYCVYLEKKWESLKTGRIKDEAKAFELLSKAAELNYPEAQYYLGRCYYFGQGVTQDKNKAYELLVLAKDLSSCLAENFIKEFYK